MKKSINKHIIQKQSVIVSINIFLIVTNWEIKDKITIQIWQNVLK